MQTLTKTEKIEQAVIDWARENDFTLALVKAQPVRDDDGRTYVDGAVAAMVSRDLGGNAHVTNVHFVLDTAITRPRIVRMQAVA